MINETINKFESEFIKNEDVLDSMQVWIRRVNTTQPELMVQTIDHVKNFDCFRKAVSQSVGNKDYSQLCDKYENIIYF